MTLPVICIRVTEIERYGCPTLNGDYVHLDRVCAAFDLDEKTALKRMGRVRVSPAGQPDAPLFEKEAT